MAKRKGRSDDSPRMFEPFSIKGVTFKNRLLRSAMGGKMAYYDGTVNEAWTRFERQFADTGVGGVISTTMTSDPRRWAPLEYPRFSSDDQIPAFKKAIRRVKQTPGGCVYLIQVGDNGYHTQGGLFPQEADGKTASGVFDFLYGYRTVATAMTEEEIDRAVQQLAAGVRRAREAGADGVEITASKGYLIHQFLNPGINRRTDGYGGSVENRFRFLREVVTASRKAVGDDYMIGVRLSALDYNYLPVNLRLPPRWPLRHYVMGNTMNETIGYAKELEALGVDFLHVTRGYGFINPKENPGDYPLDQIRIFANAVRHLSFKANFRAAVLNVIPDFLLRPILGIGWKKKPGENAEYAHEFKKVLKIPVIANGGFQSRRLVEGVLRDGKCDLVSMARPLLANRDLLQVWRDGADEPERPCSFCNRCVVLTGVQPVGCYDLDRFDGDQDAMERQILDWCGHPMEDEAADADAAE